MTGVALLGCGTWGRNLLRALSQTRGVEVVSVADKSQAALSWVRSNYPNVEVEFEESVVFEDNRVNAVAIATPASDHARAAKAVLDARKHVFVEKPLALTAGDARQLVDQARASGLTLMAGHTFIYNDAVNYAKKVIDSGDLGDLRYIYSQRLNLGVVRQDVNVLWNLGPHDVSILLHWTEASPISVQAYGMSFIRPDNEDVAFMTLRFPRGVGAHVHMSWLDPHKVRSMTVVGSRRMLVFDDAAPEERIRIYDCGVDVERRLKSGAQWDTFAEFQLRHRVGDVITPSVPYREPLANEMAAFARAVQTGEQPLTGGEHAVEVVRVLEEADRCMKREREAALVKS